MANINTDKDLSKIISQGILLPKMSHQFTVEFNWSGLTNLITSEDTDRLKKQVTNVKGFNAFPVIGDELEITFEDDKAGILDEILAKIHRLPLISNHISVAIHLLYEGEVIKVIDFGHCVVVSDMYSGLSYASIENRHNKDYPPTIQRTLVFKKS